jgi:hypothetical protein
MQEPAVPHAVLDERPGRWVAEDAWPSPRIGAVSLGLGDGTLGGSPAPGRPLAIGGSQACGLDAGLWCPYGSALDQAPDQRADDGLSLTFTTGPLEAAVEILGFPEVRLAVSADRLLALVAARLCDVAPDGVSSLVTSGLLNLAHRDGHEQPEALEPGRVYEVVVRMRAIAHAFRPGHRIRLSVSPTYWPFAWPSPEPVTLTLRPDASALVLPVRPPREQDAELPAFGEPEGSPPLALEALAEGSTTRTITRKIGSGAMTLVYTYGGGLRRLPNGTELAEAYREEFAIVEGDPLSARVRCEHRVELGRGEWRTRVQATAEMWADARDFHVRNTVVAHEGDRLIHDERRERAIPRDLV